MIQDLYDGALDKIEEKNAEIEKIKKEKKAAIAKKEAEITSINIKLQEETKEKEKYMVKFNTADSYIEEKQREFIQMQKEMLSELQVKNIQAATTDLVLDRVLKLQDDNREYFERVRRITLTFQYMTFNS